jgi:hypothetical protein
MRKYIPQATYEDFVYPNNDIAVYDNNNVVQDINSNQITGTITGFTATVTGTTINISLNYTWNRNGGEVFINQANRLHLFSIHMMTPAKKYFNPWRLVDYKFVTGATLNSYTGSFSTAVTSAEFGEAFTPGVYSFEIRFIGGLNTYIICANQTLNPAVTPTPTPSVTSSSGAPTSPTPTPSVTSSPGSPPSNTPTATPSMTPTSSSGAPATPTPTPSITPSSSVPAPPEITYYDVSGCTGGTGVIQYNGPDNFDGGEVVVSSNSNCYTIINGTPVSGPASSGIITSEVSDCSDPAC